VLPPFQTVYDAHRGVVWRFVVSVVGRQEAPDVFQETWLAALRAYPELRSTENLRGWLLTIAQRKGVDEHRSRSRRPEPAADLPDAGTAGDSPHDDALWEAVRRLPPKQRAALAHRFVADLPYADVGAVMGTTSEAARRNVHEGLQKLRATWTP
jgi:RNA polymerase sigma factor (sigma-70 family)